VSNQKVYQFSPGRASAADRRVPHNDLIHKLPNVPVLSGTLLSMELIIRQRAVNLSQVSQLVLSDLGAILQIYRQAGRENSIDGYLQRVEDCIVEIGLEACLEAVAKCPIARGPRFSSIHSAWERAREIAFIARFVAEKLDLEVAQEDAYLVGLAHGIGNLPKMLQWDCISQLGADSNLAGLRIVEAWHLPHCLAEYFLGRMAGKSQTQWTMIVDCALELLEGRPSVSICDKSISLPFTPSEKYLHAASQRPASAHY
jgi:HDOD domain